MGRFLLGAICSTIQGWQASRTASVERWSQSWCYVFAHQATVPRKYILKGRVCKRWVYQNFAANRLTHFHVAKCFAAGHLKLLALRAHFKNATRPASRSGSPHPLWVNHATFTIPRFFLFHRVLVFERIYQRQTKSSAFQQAVSSSTN
jgi:hypothetical protein